MFNVKVGDVEYHVGFYYEDNITECYIHDMTSGLKLDEVFETEAVGVGYSVCKYPDVFNKNVGRKKALKRAMDFIGMGRDTRTLFWNRYWEKRGKVD